jgi:hypothetical protein
MPKESLADIDTIFSIFHDGTICEWTGDKNLLTLKVECLYLAERINKSFDSFYIDLISIDKLLLDLWMNPVELQKQIKTELADIFKADLDIISTKTEDDHVAISCNQTDTSLDYCGGTLLLSCQSIQVFDQNKNPLKIDQLEGICKSYWDQKSEKE